MECISTWQHSKWQTVNNGNRSYITYKLTHSNKMCINRHTHKLRVSRHIHKTSYVVIHTQTHSNKLCVSWHTTVHYISNLKWKRTMIIECGKSKRKTNNDKDMVKKTQTTKVISANFPINWKPYIHTKYYNIVQYTHVHK